MGQIAYSINVDLKTVLCGNCNVWFAIPSDMHAARLRDGKNFYCPNGDFVGWSDSENARLRKEKETLERQVQQARKQKEWAQRDATIAKNQAASYKGHFNRVSRRTKGGVCPVEKCKRHFKNLERHMCSKHPGWGE